jgi:hypothetical protein
VLHDSVEFMGFVGTAGAARVGARDGYGGCSEGGEAYERNFTCYDWEKKEEGEFAGDEAA